MSEIDNKLNRGAIAYADKLKANSIGLPVSKESAQAIKRYYLKK